MTSATERFKMLLAGALERVCVLEEQLEERDKTIDELRAKLDEAEKGGET